MAKELMEIGGFITEGAEIVNHDNSLSGNGTVDSPLGVASDFIVTTEETIGTVTVTSADAGVSNTFTKAGYKPIAFNVKFPYAGLVNFNNEHTEFKSDNSLYIQGFARSTNESSWAGSIEFKALITWVKI